MTDIDQIVDNFRDSKEYRHALVEEKVRTNIAAQIRAIRLQRNLTPPEFAKLLARCRTWTCRLEDGNESPPSISTLLQVAAAFDCDLEIRFRPFSELVQELDITPESLEVPSFEE